MSEFDEVISNEAIEAAAIAMFVQTYERDEWETVINQTRYRYLRDARVALEAAAIIRKCHDVTKEEG